MKKNNTQVILFIVVGLVIIIALLIPYTTNNNSESLSVKTLSCDEENPESKHDTTLNKISCEEYNNIIEQEEEKLVLYARPTCGYCNKFVVVLEDIINEYGIDINYFDIDTLSDNEAKEFYSSSPLMSGNEFGTPTLAVIKNGTIIKYSIGYKEKEDAIDWFKDNGFID